MWWGQGRKSVRKSHPAFYFCKHLHLSILHSKFQTQVCKFGWRLISISPSQVQVICLNGPDPHLTERLPTLPGDPKVGWAHLSPPFLGSLYLHHSQERLCLPCFHRSLQEIYSATFNSHAIKNGTYNCSIHYSNISSIPESGEKNYSLHCICMHLKTVLRSPLLLSQPFPDDPLF